MHFSTSGSGGGGDRFDDPEDDFYEDAPGEQPQAPRRDRRDDPQATAARRRTVQSEPDDRYWTDYLRIALPVIGLLLVIAVFWYWAQQLIDDDDGGELNGTEPAGIAEVVETATTEPTDASTPEVADSGAGQEVTAPTSAQGTNQQDPVQPEPTPSPEPQDTADGEGVDNQLANALQETTGGGGSGEIEADMAVLVTEDGGGLSLRSDPTTAEENIVATLDAGTELTVVSGPMEAEGYSWWEIVVTATGDGGWVVEEFIVPAE